MDSFTKEAMNLKERKEFYTGWFRQREEKKKLYNDIIISKLKKIIKRIESQRKMQRRKLGSSVYNFFGNTSVKH